MSLRMNLYSFELSSLIELLSSGEQGILAAAHENVEASLRAPDDRERAKLWVSRLVRDGVLLARDREPPSTPSDGDLLVSRLETELHVVGLFALIRAMTNPQALDLAVESSSWTRETLGAVIGEMRECGFLGSAECPRVLRESLAALDSGTPLFGDGFRTDWSYYSILQHAVLGETIAALERACAYRRPIPAYVPESVRKSVKAELSEAGRALVQELRGWLGKVMSAGHDALVLWW